MNTYFDEIKLVNTGGKEEPVQVEVIQEGCFTRIKVSYMGMQPTRVARAIISRFRHNQPGETKCYAEAYSKLSQTEGTLKNPRHITAYSDVAHYKLPQEEGYFTAYNMEDTPKCIDVDLKGQYDVVDFWNNQSYGSRLSELTITLEPHSAIVLKCLPNV